MLAHKRPGVELILPVLDREADLGGLLGDLTSRLFRLAAPAAVAVVDQGSSDRTVEVVDQVAAVSAVPIRVLGCSAPGWGRAAQRAVSTSAAHWVAFGDPGTPGLPHALDLLSAGDHIVCVRTGDGPGIIVLETPVAALLFGENLPGGPDFVPVLEDKPSHAGLRMDVLSGPLRAPVGASREMALEMVAR